MIEIYGKKGCTFCKRSKMLCDMKGVEYVYKALDVDYTKEELMSAIPSTHRSFPAIFIDGSFLGGFEDLKSKIG